MYYQRVSTLRKNAAYFEIDKIHQHHHHDHQKEMTSSLDFVVADEMKFLQNNLLCGTSAVGKAYM